MTCENCKNMVVLHAFSFGECTHCFTDVSTSHIPCDKLCLECSELLNKCQSCGDAL